MRFVHYVHVHMQTLPDFAGETYGPGNDEHNDVELRPNAGKTQQKPAWTGHRTTTCIVLPTMGPGDPAPDSANYVLYSPPEPEPEPWPGPLPPPIPPNLAKLGPLSPTGLNRSMYSLGGLTGKGGGGPLGAVKLGPLAL